LHFWPYAKFFLSSKGGHRPSGPMVNTPLASHDVSCAATLH